MNFERELLGSAPPDAIALIELGRDGSRRLWSFAEIEQATGRVAAALALLGVGRGDVVMTLIGNRSEWVLTMMACFRLGAIALPCSEQLRAGDLARRLEVVEPSLVVCDERNREQLEGSPWSGPTLWCPWEVSQWPREPVPGAAELAPEDPCLITFTSGTSGEPRAVMHAQRYLCGQRLQAGSWLGAGPGDVVWCTASSGWSKSARNVFIAPWLRGAAALLHDRRFDPEERLAVLLAEDVSHLCMAPTEYRIIAKRARLQPLPALRGMVAAGEALNPEVLRAWEEATGLWIRDGYGQTETGQMTGVGPGERPRPGSMGRALPGVALSVLEGELVADPPSVPTFFLGYIGEEVARDEVGTWHVTDRRAAGEPWRTGDRVECDEDGYLYFEGRADDVIVSAGYRIGPFEVESALVAHPAVAEAAAVAAPDEDRGAVVRAVVVLRDGYEPSPGLARELQEHVRELTAPYKYPRIVDFARELPKTASGKVRHAQLRSGSA